MLQFSCDAKNDGNPFYGDIVAKVSRYLPHQPHLPRKRRIKRKKKPQLKIHFTEHLTTTRISWIVFWNQYVPVREIFSEWSVMSQISNHNILISLFKSRYSHGCVFYSFVKKIFNIISRYLLLLVLNSPSSSFVYSCYYHLHYIIIPFKTRYFSLKFWKG